MGTSNSKGPKADKDKVTPWTLLWIRTSLLHSGAKDIIDDIETAKRVVRRRIGAHSKYSGENEKNI
jgi:hypothetical protein